MSVEANKKIAERFVDIFNRRDWPALPDLFTPDAHWWMAGDTKYTPYAGDHSAADNIKGVQGLMNRFDNWHTKIINLFATEDQVLLEWELGGTDREHPDMSYDISIAMVMKVQDGKIAGIREYFDTAGPERFYKALQTPA